MTDDRIKCEEKLINSNKNGLIESSSEAERILPITLSSIPTTCSSTDAIHHAPKASVGMSFSGSLKGAVATPLVAVAKNSMNSSSSSAFHKRTNSCDENNEMDAMNTRHFENSIQHNNAKGTHLSLDCVFFVNPFI